MQVWDIEGNCLVRELPAQNHWVRALVLSERFLYSGSYQAVKVSVDMVVVNEIIDTAWFLLLLQVWNLESLECIRVLECPGGSVYSLCVTNHFIMCGTYENKINVCLSGCEEEECMQRVEWCCSLGVGC